MWFKKLNFYLMFDSFRKLWQKIEKYAKTLWLVKVWGSSGSVLKTRENRLFHPHGTWLVGPGGQGWSNLLNLDIWVI
jgi:hypothetical protein